MTTVRELVGTVAAQRRAIERLTEQLALSNKPDGQEKPDKPDEPATPELLPRAPIDWGGLTGERRRDTWLGLAAFVERIVFRHSLHFDVMPCWWQHRDAVELLGALWQVHEVTHTAGANLNSSLQWINTVMNNLGRLRGIFQSCRDGHLDTTPRAWMPDRVRAEFQRMVDAP